MGNVCIVAADHIEKMSKIMVVLVARRSFASEFMTLSFNMNIHIFHSRQFFLLHFISGFFFFLFIIKKSFINSNDDYIVMMMMAVDGEYSEFMMRGSKDNIITQLLLLSKKNFSRKKQNA